MARHGMEPLSPEELDRLQGTLVEQMDTTGCMPLDVAHGFLTASAATPSGRQSALIDRVLGGLGEQAALRGLVARFRAQLLDDLHNGDYGPLILQMPRDDGTSLPLPYGWCQGYLAGVEFAGEAARNAMLADEEAGTLLTPVLSFLMYEKEQWFDPPDEAAHRETVGQLGEAAVALYQWAVGHSDSTH